MGAKDLTMNNKKPRPSAGVVAGRVVLALGLVFFGLFSLASLLGSSRLPTTDPDETVLYRWDLFPVTLLVTAAFVAVCAAASKRGLGRYLPQAFLQRALTVYVAVLGVAWLFLVRARPQADPYITYTLANQFSGGHYIPIEDEYLRFFPFQLGYIFFLEMIARVVGSENYLFLQVLNVGFVALLFNALIGAAKALFPDRRVAWLLTLLLFGCLQPVMYATLVYGNVPGYAMAALAFWCMARYLAGHRARWLAGCVACSAGAWLLKNNTLICIIAIAIVLVFDFVKTRKARSLVGVAGLALAVAFAIQPVYAYYRLQSGLPISDGIPKTAWAAMGLRDSNKAPGWFNYHTEDLYRAAGEDTGQAARLARESMAESLEGFAKDPAGAIAFFAQKNFAQWCEPTYGCIQHSHYLSTHDYELPRLARSMYEGGLYRAAFEYFNWYQFLVAALALCGLVLCRRSLTLPQLSMLLAVLGGFAFHTVWEGKAMYIWPYFLLCVPYAAAGLNALLAWLGQRGPFPRGRKAAWAGGAGAPQNT